MTDLWTEAMAENYDEDVKSEFAPEVVGPTVDFLAGLAGGGRALEFAIGTGRIGVPLAQRGVQVTGIELSAPMAARARLRLSEEELPIVIGDMATTTVEGEFSLVYLVFNTISNLQTQAEQTACFRNAAYHLAPGGRFVIELWTPTIRALTPGSDAVVTGLGDGYLSLDTYDLATQACTSQFYTHRADGSVRYQIGHFRYLWPAECDLMAQLAGLSLETRMSDWSGGEFTSKSTKHVSVWRKAA